MQERRPDPYRELDEARREAEYYRRIAEEAGSRHLREAEALSRLLERAQQAEREVQQARDELERRVEERTAELTVANAHLAGVIADRERAEVARRASEEERRGLERQMEQAQRIDSLGVLAGGIAHDFNNLLGAIQANVAILRRERSQPMRDGEVDACLADVESAVQAATGLCRQMLAYAGRAPFFSEPLELGVVVRDIVQLLRSSVSRRLGLELRLAERLPLVRGDPSQLRQVAMNLVINAAEAMGEKDGTVTVTTGVLQAGAGRLRETLLGEALAEGRYVFLEVADTGCGMDDATQRRIFEPFFTTKFAGRGLGLSAVLGIVRQLRGGIELESAPGRGTRFRVLFPAAEGAAPVAEPAPAPAPDDWTGEGLVLVVDDEPAIRRALGRLVSWLGFEMLEAPDGAEGVELYRRNAGRIRAAIVDLTMPHLDGVETLRALRRLDPDAYVLIASGYAEAEVAARFRGESPDGFVHKPFDLEALRALLRAALERRRPPPKAAAGGDGGMPGPSPTGAAVSSRDRGRTSP